MKTLKTLVLSLAAGAALLGAVAAHAGVAWSVDIGVPGVAAVVGSPPDDRPVPRVYLAPPVVYAPARVYAPPQVVEYVPAPIRYVPPPRYYASVPVAAYPEVWHNHRVWEHWRDGRWVHERDGRDFHDFRDGHDGRDARWSGRP